MHGVIPAPVRLPLRPLLPDVRRRRRRRNDALPAIAAPDAAADPGLAGSGRWRQVAQILEAVRSRADAVASSGSAGAVRQPPVEREQCAASPEVLNAISVVVFDDQHLASLEQDPHCAICCVDFGAGDMLACLPGCHHLFHNACVQGWFARAVTCPLCRGDLATAVGAMRCPVDLVARSLADRRGAAEHFLMAASVFLQRGDLTGPRPWNRLSALQSENASSASRSEDVAAVDRSISHKAVRDSTLAPLPEIIDPVGQEPHPSAMLLDAIKQGWLLKLSLTPKRWHRRWFVLMPDRLLSFRKKIQTHIDSSLIVDDVKLCSRCSVRPHHDTGPLHRLCLDTPAETVQLAALGSPEHSSWIHSIRKQTEQQKTDVGTNRRRQSRLQPLH